MLDKKSILILGSNGFVGQNLKKYLLKNFNEGPFNFIFHHGKEEVDLLNEKEFDKYLVKHKPQKIINCSAFVGGISYGAKYPGKILHDNSKMILNIYETSRINNVNQIINPISNCAYPGNRDVYIESEFWDGKPHDSVFNYALSRRLIVALGESYFNQYKLNSCNIVLSNMYGKYDHFDESRSHALGAILDKVYKAKVNGEKTVTIWGTGTPIREWLFVEDGAKSLVKCLDLDVGNYFFNIGVNKGISIKDLAEKIKNLLSWDGDFEYDKTKPNGALEKRVEAESMVNILNWKPETSLDEGLKQTVDWYVKQQ